MAEDSFDWDRCVFIGEFWEYVWAVFRVRGRDSGIGGGSGDCDVACISDDTELGEKGVEIDVAWNMGNE